MAINFPTGTQGFPGVAHRFFYADDGQHRSLGIGNNWTQIPGLALNAATQNTSNRLLIMPSVSWSANTTNLEVGFAITANGTPIGVGTSGVTGSNVLDRVAYGIGDTSNAHVGWKMTQWQQHLLYHPNTTSTITYTIYIRGRSSGTVNINRLDSISSLEGFTGHSELLIMELEA